MDTDDILFQQRRNKNSCLSPMCQYLNSLSSQQVIWTMVMVQIIFAGCEEYEFKFIGTSGIAATVFIN